MSPEKTWTFVADPGRLPRWWPSVDRVDRPSESSYTRWVLSPRGRAVPMAFHLIGLDQGSSVEWEQQISGTAFERSVRKSTEKFEVKATDSGSQVRLTIQRTLKGSAKLGSFFVGRGQKRELTLAAEALRKTFA